jgi:hypothetical protein
LIQVCTRIEQKAKLLFNACQLKIQLSKDSSAAFNRLVLGVLDEIAVGKEDHVKIFVFTLFSCVERNNGIIHTFYVSNQAVNEALHSKGMAILQANSHLIDDILLRPSAKCLKNETDRWLLLTAILMKIKYNNESKLIDNIHIFKKKLTDFELALCFHCVDSQRSLEILVHELELRLRTKLFSMKFVQIILASLKSKFYFKNYIVDMEEEEELEAYLRYELDKEALANTWQAKMGPEYLEKMKELMPCYDRVFALVETLLVKLFKGKSTTFQAVQSSYFEAFPAHYLELSNNWYREASNVFAINTEKSVQIEQKHLMYIIHLFHLNRKGSIRFWAALENFMVGDEGRNILNSSPITAMKGIIQVFSQRNITNTQLWQTFEQVPYSLTQYLTTKLKTALFVANFKPISKIVQSFGQVNR